MIRLVLFDIDGTLIDAGGVGTRAINRAWELVFGEADALRGMKLGGRTDASIFSQLYQRFGREVVATQHETFVASFHHLLAAYLPGSDGRTLAGTAELIAGMQQATPGPMLGLLTGNTRMGAEIKLRHFGLWEHFEVGAFGDEHPSRDRLASIVWQRGSGRIGRSLRGNEILVIGDTVHDVQCARSIGASCLAVATGSDSHEALAAAGPTKVVESLADVAAEAILTVEQ